MILHTLLALCLQSPRDVVMFVSDDVGLADEDQLVSSGDLPDLMDLAASGVRFTQARVQPVCSQTRMGLIAGRWAFADAGVVCGPSLTSAIQPSEVTIADVAKSAGLATGLFGKLHVGPHWDPSARWEDLPAALGFDHAVWTPMNMTSCGGTAWTAWTGVRNGVAAVENGYAPEVFEAAFAAWWAATPGPRFALFTVPWAHGPVHWPPSHLLPPGYPTTGPTRFKYLAEIVAMWRQVGRLRTLVGPETTFVYLSDNGTPANVSPLDNTPGGNLFPFPAKGTCGERGIRVNLMISGPGLPKAVEDDRAASSVDLIPTLAALLGVSAPLGMPGRDLLAPAVRIYTLSGNAVGDSLDDMCAVGRFGPNILFKLRVKGAPGARTEALYNLIQDPFEHTPLLPDSRPNYSEFLRNRLTPEMP